uniref:Uncharacterized protein n=1 Tax=Rhizophora mucronata TaxID=61149 RepID=A0A2P2QYZ6_RHIMU
MMTRGAPSEGKGKLKKKNKNGVIGGKIRRNKNDGGLSICYLESSDILMWGFGEQIVFWSNADYYLVYIRE